MTLMEPTLLGVDMAARRSASSSRISLLTACDVRQLLAASDFFGDRRGGAQGVASAACPAPAAAHATGRHAQAVASQRVAVPAASPPDSLLRPIVVLAREYDLPPRPRCASAACCIRRGKKSKYLEIRENAPENSTPGGGPLV